MTSGILHTITCFFTREGKYLIYVNRNLPQMRDKCIKNPQNSLFSYYCIDSSCNVGKKEMRMEMLMFFNETSSGHNEGKETENSLNEIQNK